ncbi:MAG: ABC transporter ATP-binding protein [Firmicutes bacterium]|nr:ABC transporter ATP-binding protein [Bacillota bacterium]
MADFYGIAENNSINEILQMYPIAYDFFANMNLGKLEKDLPLPEALERADQEWISELGTDIDDVLEQFADFLQALSVPEDIVTHIESITIIGGSDKNGVPEDVELTVKSGEVLSIVGPTGSGKSRLLGDIECIAQGDTPTGRFIKINGRLPGEELRFELEGQLVAQLSQNMNFVVDLNVRDFLEMHAKSRFCEDPEDIVNKCFECANELAGEKFTEDVKVTQLSGGQSRALMIADTAYMSSSPIVLIDEIENAGIDRKQAISILTKNDKVVFISTHDPLLALSADKRIVIKNGGISKIIETSEEERKSQVIIEKLDNVIMNIRNMLRYGEFITPESLNHYRE